MELKVSWDLDADPKLRFYACMARKVELISGIR
jgi:hypothetical protein